VGDQEPNKMLEEIGHMVRPHSGIINRTSAGNDNTSCDETYRGVNFDSISEDVSKFDGEKSL